MQANVVTLALISFSLCILRSSASDAPTEKVGWAGFAFRGKASKVASQYPLSSRFVKDIQDHLREQIATLSPENFVLETDALLDWRKGEEISLACVMDFEQEILAPIYDVATEKLFYILGAMFSGEAMLLDYPRSKVIGSTPFTCYITNAFPVKSEKQLERMVKRLLMHPDAGFIAEFIKAARSMHPKRKTGAAILVRPVELSDSARSKLGIDSSETNDRWAIFFANRIGAILAQVHQAAIMPSVKDAATEKIRLRFADTSELELRLDEPAYVMIPKVEGIARYQDPKQSNEVRDVVIYGAKGVIQVLNGSPGAGKSWIEKWVGTWGREFVRGKQFTEAEPFYYRSIIEGALLETVERKLLEKSNSSRNAFEEMIRKCRI
jgi:hypothetical protein